MDASEYLSEIRARMDLNGYDRTIDALPPGAALVGYRSDFRLSWLATQLRLFITVKYLDSAALNDVEQFTRDSLAVGKRVKGRFRGLQNGVGVIAVLVAGHVEPDAVWFAELQLVRQFAAFAWPVTVDLSTGRRAYQRGNPRIGRVYNRWMRQQIDLVIPAPSASSA